VKLRACQPSARLDRKTYFVSQSTVTVVPVCEAGSLYPVFAIEKFMFWVIFQEANFFCVAPPSARSTEPNRLPICLHHSAVRVRHHTKFPGAKPFSSRPAAIRNNDRVVGTPIG